MHSTEEPLDPTAAAGLTRGRKDELHLQVGGDLLHVPRSEVRTVVGIEDARNAADWPVRILLAPDALPECQRCAQDRRWLKRKIVARNRSAIVVDNDCQPGLRNRAVVAH